LIAKPGLRRNAFLGSKSILARRFSGLAKVCPEAEGTRVSSGLTSKIAAFEKPAGW
jgi:hypothetical protein